MTHALAQFVDLPVTDGCISVESVKISGFELFLEMPILLQPGQRLIIAATRGNGASVVLDDVSYISVEG